MKITKTPKCYVGGAFIRSESGRVAALTDAAGNFLCNIPLCTRKDLRNAVEAAAKAGAGWAKRTPYNRAQILYRLAEMIESRADEMAAVTSTKEVRAAIVWLVIARAYRRGVAGIEASPERRRALLGAALKSSET